MNSKERAQKSLILKSHFPLLEIFIWETDPGSSEKSLIQLYISGLKVLNLYS